MKEYCDLVDMSTNCGSINDKNWQVSIYLSIYLSTYEPLHICIYLFMYLFILSTIDLFTVLACLLIYVSTYLLIEFYILNGNVMQ